MIVKSYLIADSPICGKDQVISGTILYPWKGCKVADKLEAHNEKVIADALALAKECEFSNIRGFNSSKVQLELWIFSFFLPIVILFQFQ